MSLPAPSSFAQSVEPSEDSVRSWKQAIVDVLYLEREKNYSRVEAIRLWLKKHKMEDREQALQNAISKFKRTKAGREWADRSSEPVS